MTPLSFEYPISVAILYFGGTTGDLEDTVKCVQGITEALEDQGHVVRILEVTKNNWHKAVRLPGEVVFNLVEDPEWDLYIKVGKRLEELGRAQMGHDMRSFMYAIKKAWVKRKLDKAGIGTPRYRILNRRSNINVRGLDYPLMVKPSGQHAGIGISQDSVVIDAQELEIQVNYLFKHYPGEVIVEEYVDGREIHVTVLGNGRRIVALPPAEILFGGEFADNWGIYDYEAKWDKSSWEYWDARTIVSRLPKKLEKKITAEAIRAFKAFGCRDIARMDIRLDDKKQRPYIVDVNLSPSLNQYDNQDATIASIKALGWSYPEFIETLIAITYKRVYGKLPDRIRERQLLLTT